MVILAYHAGWLLIIVDTRIISTGLVFILGVRSYQRYSFQEVSFNRQLIC